jgi:Icc-related predicted phosphoesterase
MASLPLGDALILGAPDGVEGKATNLPSHQAINAFNEKLHDIAVVDGGLEKKDVLEPEIGAALPLYADAENSVIKDNEEHIIITGADAAAHLLPMRDDFESALTFRSIFLASILAAFQAVVYQIYQVSSCHSFHLLVIAHH